MFRSSRAILRPYKEQIQGYLSVLCTLGSQALTKCGVIIITVYSVASRTVPGSIPGVTRDFFRGTPDRTMCPEVDSASESEYQVFLLG